MDADESHPLSNVPRIIDNVNDARRAFYSRLRSLRLGFGVMICIQSFLEDGGYKGLDWSVDAKKGGLCTAMINLLKGHFTRDVKELVRYTRFVDSMASNVDCSTMLRKLRRDELTTLSGRLHEIFSGLPPSVLSEERASLDQLARIKNSVSESGASDVPPADISASLSDWVAQYLGYVKSSSAYGNLHSMIVSESLKLPEEGSLWDIWYTGLAPFPSEVGFLLSSV